MRRRGEEAEVAWWMGMESGERKHNGMDIFNSVGCVDVERGYRIRAGVQGGVALMSAKERCSWRSNVYDHRDGGWRRKRRVREDENDNRVKWI